MNTYRCIHSKELKIYFNMVFDGYLPVQLLKYVELSGECEHQKKEYWS